MYIYIFFNFNSIDYLVCKLHFLTSSLYFSSVTYVHYLLYPTCPNLPADLSHSTCLLLTLSSIASHFRYLSVKLTPHHLSSLYFFPPVLESPPIPFTCSHPPDNHNRLHLFLHQFYTPVLFIHLVLPFTTCPWVKTVT